MKPRSLRPGDTVAVIGPASAPTDYEKLAAGIETLRARGYVVETARDSFERCGYLCGTDEERLAELNGFLRRPDVKALFCVRGGYGTLRLLPEIDYQAARANPKLVIGYSDITALHMALYRHAGLTGISGPMIGPEWSAPDPASEALFWELASGGAPAPLLGPGGETLQPMRAGAAEGVLLGGNLTLIARLVGTPYLPDLRGAILFLEEVGEQPYRIDGMLAQLRLSGILEHLGGLVLGGFTDWEPPEGRPTLSLEEVFAHYTKDLTCPVAKGLVYGHFPVKSAIPVGVRARLEVTGHSAALHVLEPVVD